jgi:hypothetical protein
VLFALVGALKGSQGGGGATNHELSNQARVKTDTNYFI